MQNEVIRTCEILATGGMILYPTDTVWGIGCDATNAHAVSKIFTLKKRQESKSMIVLVDSEEKLFQYVQEVPEMALELVRITETPLTIIYPHAVNVASNLIAPDDTLAIRITGDPFCKTLIARFGKPLVSTSANSSGMPPPNTFQNIDPGIKSGVDYVVNWRQHETKPGKPSGIIKVGVNGEIKVIRQ